MSCWRSPAYFFSLEFFNFDVVQNIYNIQNKHLLSITISKFFTWVVWLAMILEDFCRQVTQFQVNVLSSNRYKNLLTLPILESHTAQQVRRVHRYRRYDHKISNKSLISDYDWWGGKNRSHSLTEILTGDWWLPTAAASMLIDFPGLSVNTVQGNTKEVW